MDDDDGLRVYFNPFVHTIEENNEFLRRGYEVMPISVPTDEELTAMRMRKPPLDR